MQQKMMVAVAVVEDDNRNKMVNVQLNSADGTLQAATTLDGESAEALGAALIRAGKAAQSLVVVGKPVPITGRT